MSNGWGQFSQTLPVRLLLWFDRSLHGRILGGLATGIVIFVLAGGMLFYLNITGATSVNVQGDGNTITIPRAPREITPQKIACDGAVEVVSRAAVSGYRAIYPVMEDDGISTTYFLSLSVDAQGQPVSQFSVNWEHEDGVVDSLDGPAGGVRVPVDDRTLRCLQTRAK